MYLAYHYSIYLLFHEDEQSNSKTKQFISYTPDFYNGKTRMKHKAVICNYSRNKNGEFGKHDCGDLDS